MRALERACVRLTTGILNLFSVARGWVVGGCVCVGGGVNVVRRPWVWEIACVWCRPGKWCQHTVSGARQAGWQRLAVRAVQYYFVTGWASELYKSALNVAHQSFPERTHTSRNTLTNTSSACTKTTNVYSTRNVRILTHFHAETSLRNLTGKLNNPQL